MVKKFLSAVILAFAFLFLNLSFNEVKAESLPGDIMANAGIGTKKGYWAIADLGADYIGDSEITIDIQQEAIANQEVNSIVIVESGYSLQSLVHYERNVSSEFSSKITYTLKNTDYGEKYLTVLLLREFAYIPTDALIIDKITIGLNHKRTISGLSPDDILVIKENESVGAPPYKVSVTLPNEIFGKGRIEDYVFKSVKYTLAGSDEQYSALYQGLNNYYFTVYQNGTYTIEIEDVFGARVQKEIVIDNLRDPEIIIELENIVTTPTKNDFFIDVKVKYYTSKVELNSDELAYLFYRFNEGSNINILSSKQVKVDQNGIYTIYASSINGSLAELSIEVTNIDKEAPYVQVLERNVVYTNSVRLFNPRNDIFTYDNVSLLDNINVTLTFYTVSGEAAHQLLTTDLEEARNYLYTVRDLAVRYKVTDEAGNSVERDSYIQSIDDTIPVIYRTTNRKDFYINDPYPTAAEIEAAYGIVVEDNSCTYNSSCKDRMDYYLDFSRLPVDDNQRLNRLGIYNIFVSAIDESGNYSESISVEAEVRKKLITIEADDDQYIIYGDVKADEIRIGYHCVTRDGRDVDCSEELLEGDTISGELYVKNAVYVGTYEIFYDNISIPSDLYYLAYGNVNTFTIKHRTMKIIAHDKEKYYLDEDPELTYEIDTRVCDSNNVDYYNKDYRCTFAPDSGDYIGGELERYMGEAPEGIEVWDNNGTLRVSEIVWYDSDGNLVPRDIFIGTVKVYETYNGGYENYHLDFDAGGFLIKPKHIEVYIKNASKIYGEADPVYEIEQCRGDYPINGETNEFCAAELALEINRTVSGETVKVDAYGNYIDYYKLEGIALNRNYEVLFHNAYLTIERRDISISIKGDLDADGNPTGKYTIYYEDDIPIVEMYDSSSGDKTGLVVNGDLGIEDKFSTARASIYTPDGTLVTDYVNGIGIYVIQKGDMKIIDITGADAEYNYNITFNPGELEVIKKDIWIKIIENLTKIYGDDDHHFDNDYLEANYPDKDYIILEANGRFVIEIIPTETPGSDPYIPRDNDSMRYHLIREEGIYVGEYAISIEKLIGCENYDVYLYDEYKYKIELRDLEVSIDNQTIVYKESLRDEIRFSVADDSLQYDDYLQGEPDVGEYRDVGTYHIGVGSIRVYDLAGTDVSFNYNISTSGGILKIVPREISIEVKPNQSKQYGEDDPKLEFLVYYNGVIEEMLEYDYHGTLGREAGEVPGDYPINWGDFGFNLNGRDDDGNRVANYTVKEFKNDHPFKIEKRTIVVTARDVEAFYGNDYEDDVVYDAKRYTEDGEYVAGGLAYNLTLKIDGVGIHDIFDGDLRIIGTVDGVGEYEISAADIRILRKSTLEDVTNLYYNFTYVNGTLIIKARTIKITPHEGQSKIYGENDGVNGITYSYSDADLIDPRDEFIGSLERTPRDVNGVMVTEAVGEYVIELGTLAVKTPSGKENYNLVLDGTVAYVINPRTLAVKADDIEIYYGDPFELKWSIIDGSLANNPSIGIVDTISGELNLDRAYTGYGTYDILGDNLVLTNATNYKYTFQRGLLIVNKKKLVVTPLAETLSKVYGEDDPINYNFTTSVEAPYTGALTRESGINVGSYRILMGTLDFGENYDVTLQEAYFTILKREIIVTAEDSGKLYNTADPKLTYLYQGTLIGGDKFYGSLTREIGEDVGTYAILQGTLALTNNYDLKYNPGVFTIYYAEFTGLTIYSLTNNQYQVKGLETEVQLYARFNEGADESNIARVEWKIIKNGNLNWDFTKDGNNIVSFFPSGSLGTYVVSASYEGKVAYYEVYVEQASVGNISIEHVSGETTQILGREKELVYKVIVDSDTDMDATLQWLINGIQVQANKVKDSIYLYYTPNMGKGKYTVQARIGNAISMPLEFIVNNNNPPVITLIGDSVVYVEAKTAKYIEQGATVTDDLDGNINSSLVITGYVNEDVKGTYYIRYDAKDSHGNNAISVYRQVVVRDTTKPVVTLNGNAEIKLLYGQEYIEYGATAVDNYDGELEVTITNTVIIDKVSPHGEPYVVTYTAMDSSGNIGVAIRYVEIIDNISPVITLVGKEITYVEVYSEYKDEGALIEDNVDGTFVMPATSFFYGEEEVDGVDTSRLGTYYVHYDYKDTSGNIGAGKVRIVIVRDSTPPVITLNGTNPYIIRYSYPTINYVEPGAVAKDNYDEFVPVTITGNIGNELGSYYMYYNAVDAHGNIATTVVREVIVIDVENPIIHFFDRCPQYITIEALYEEYDTRCDAPGYGIWVEDDYMADLEELQKRVVVTGSVDSTTVGTYVIRYDVSDMAGNPAVTLSRYIRVVDTTAPTITLLCEGGNPCGSDSSQTVEVFTQYEELGAIVTDRYDDHHGVAINLVINHNINVNKLGEYYVTYNAVDSNGNRAEPIVRRVYVKDTTPPDITLFGDNPMTIERGLEYVEFGATVIDNYDGPMTRYSILNAPSGMSLGTFEVIYRAVDSSGNIGEKIRIVNVVDTIPPIVLGVEDGKYYKEPVSIYLVPTLGTDEVLTGWLNGVRIESPHYVDKEGEYDLLVKDDAGNEVNIWFAIDTTPPEILGVRNGEYTNKEVVEVYSNEKIKYYEYRFFNGAWERSEEQTLSFTEEGTYRIYAVDMADNVSSVVMFVIDRTAPNYSLTGVLNKGVTDTNVRLVTEENATVVVNASYTIPTLYTFENDGYYQIVIRDLAGNSVNLQFVINKTKTIMVNGKLVTIISQHDAISKMSITGRSYNRNSGIMLTMPQLAGGFTYVNGKLFSESEYQLLLSGGTLEIPVSETNDTFMFVGFVVASEELNKFGSQTVDGDKEDDEGGAAAGYSAAIIILALALGGGIFFFVKRRRRQEEEEEIEEETIYEDYDD